MRLDDYSGYTVLDDAETFGGIYNAEMVLIPIDIEPELDCDFDDLLESIPEADKQRVIRIDLEKVVKALLADPKLLEMFLVTIDDTDEATDLSVQ